MPNVGFVVNYVDEVIDEAISSLDLLNMLYLLNIIDEEDI
jgi:hypothetical protein